VFREGIGGEEAIAIEQRGQGEQAEAAAGPAQEVTTRGRPRGA
jgi:hypothetical protein